MIKIESIHVDNMKRAVYSARNAMNSWDKSDSHTCCGGWKPTDKDAPVDCSICPKYNGIMCTNNNLERFDVLGENDLKLAQKLVKAGSDHSKFMRMINVTLDITAPLYWWKEFDTYKVGTVRNSCSTMHKVTEKEFTLDDFSHEHIEMLAVEKLNNGKRRFYLFDQLLNDIIETLNIARAEFLKTNDKKYWWQIIQLLPSSYNQKATVQLNYAVLRNMYHSRQNHKLDEWVEFCKWVETLPYSELITA